MFWSRTSSEWLIQSIFCSARPLLAARPALRVAPIDTLMKEDSSRHAIREHAILLLIVSYSICLIFSLIAERSEKLQVDVID